MSDYYTPAPPTDYHPVTTPVRPGTLPARQPRRAAAGPRVLSVVQDPTDRTAVIITFSEDVNADERIATSPNGQPILDATGQMILTVPGPPLKLDGADFIDFEEAGDYHTYRMFFDAPVTGRGWSYPTNDPEWRTDPGGRLVQGATGTLP